MSAPRVIAGELGGRRLKVPRGLATRPTAARVRGALFNVLGDVSGLAVLDLYAGSGALAIEALSRGASRAVLVEHERAALESIRENLDALGVGSRAVLVSRRLPAALATVRSHAPFDLVLCDPPWADLDAACATLAELARTTTLAPDALVVLEHAARDVAPEVAGLVAFERRAWGDTAVSLFRGQSTVMNQAPRP